MLALMLETAPGRIVTRATTADLPGSLETLAAMGRTRCRTGDALSFAVREYRLAPGIAEPIVGKALVIGDWRGDDDD